ncbi:MAG: hypothetical protein ACPF9W_13075, partial [Nocardioides sp.]
RLAQMGRRVPRVHQGRRRGGAALGRVRTQCRRRAERALVVARGRRERGWGPYSQATFDQGASPEGSIFVGSPETVAQKIAWAVRSLGLSRFQLKYAVGSLPHEQRLESIRLYGTEVIPRVRELLAQG